MTKVGAFTRIAIASCCVIVAGFTSLPLTSCSLAGGGAATDTDLSGELDAAVDAKLRHSALLKIEKCEKLLGDLESRPLKEDDDLVEIKARYAVALKLLEDGSLDDANARLQLVLNSLVSENWVADRKRQQSFRRELILGLDLLDEPRGESTEEIRPLEPRSSEPPAFGPAGGIDWLLRYLHGTATYQDGMLTLSYSIGQGSYLQKDVIQRLGGKTTYFEGTHGVGTDAYLMAGNTQGYVLLKPVFRDSVRLEVSFQSQLNLHPATFQLVLMSDPGGEMKLGVVDPGSESCYGSHYGTDIRIVSRTKGQNRIPSTKKDFHGNNVNNWLQRREPIDLVFEYHKESEAEKGKLRVFHDGEEVCRYETDFLRSGHVGFRWDNSKWFITNLTVTGRVDQDWLMRMATR